MTNTDSSTNDQSLGNPGEPYRWYKELNRYHWFVLIVSALGWLFDCLDQQLFILARQPAMRDLLPKISDPQQFKVAVDTYSTYATAIFMIGWATGGLIFGVIGDRFGRAKTMLITILLYSAFTGLSALSVSFIDFSIYRFMTGLGVGGEFAVGVALVAEIMPERARPYALSFLQALSAVGNITAALLNMLMGGLLERGLVDSAWRPLFVVGALPALLALLIRSRLKEPERWQKMSHDGTVKKQLGSYGELFAHPTWRRHALLGMALAFSGVVGLWAVGFFTMDLVGNVLQTRFTEAGLEAKVVASHVGFWKSVTSIMINFGAGLGMYSFGLLSQRIGRKPTFAIAFLAAFVSTASVFWFMNEFWHIFVLAPIMGFCQLSIFGGYAMYFPELFPTHLRSTGTSFCYNVGRFVSAGGLFVLGLLTSRVFQDTSEPLRYAGLTMCSIFFVGLMILPFLPETKGQPLPE